MSDSEVFGDEELQKKKKQIFEDDSPKEQDWSRREQIPAPNMQQAQLLSTSLRDGVFEKEI